MSPDKKPSADNQRATWLWSRLQAAAEAQDYPAAYRLLAELHTTLDRRCACGRPAMKDGPHCIACWGRTPACAAMLDRVASDVTRAVAVLDKADLEARVVATVPAEPELALPRGSKPRRRPKADA